jgi:hypothetical protein
MSWELVEHPEVQTFRTSLDAKERERVDKAYKLLAIVGPQLGRPYVDRIAGSTIHHLKELRVSGRGEAEYRILFAFDPLRQAVLLVAGNKKGEWHKWYRSQIRLAEQRYEEHLRSRGLFMT